MTESPTMPDNAPDPLRLERCPDCGYSLMGLPERGICPECGFAYNRDMIALYGRTLDRTVGAVPRRTWNWRILKGLAIIAVVAASMPIHRELVRAVPALAAMPWGLFIVFGVLLYRKWRASQDELSLKTCTQLRLSSQGFAQRDYIGPVELHPWTDNLWIRIKIRPWSLYYLERRWPASQRRVRIRIGRGKGFFRLVRTLVDFQFDCQEDTSLRLQRQIERWHTEATSKQALGGSPAET